MIGSKFCFTHNPDTKELKRAAVIKGGKMSKKSRSLFPPVILTQPKDVVALLAATINEVRGGSMELRIANCIGYLSGHLIKAIEIADLGERVSKLEEAFNKK
ncbi:MAG: hypothetical protein COT92_01895 [Candidatus Doudnabacteria bacterium CG10_big_fil_rev_8_21_14_0_10_42_18]|uniref:Uncharacterized protein n=1 Tax=Candidatus Doudnabacteria bacterium CG10_big_fil_rev_8_21_14_0_10_42_18 TaxID=1974552 RepID=A0A2H0VB44_9BACT|nr:MAG: hypothetical protein COT92_01895 [Candidatus Doudnabacteria bacterium CG10_big_fil_rev_8_21_14_0_10_42_18]